MTIKERLDRRVEVCTVIPDCEQYRIALYLWSNHDKGAEAFGKRLLELCPGFAEGKAVSEGESLKPLLQQCIKWVENCKASCPRGLYILLIRCDNTLPDLIDPGEIKKLFPTYRIERLTPLETEKLFETPSMLPTDNFYSAEWLIDKRDIDAACLLLKNAALGRELLSANLKKAVIKFTKYSAIKEDICRRMISTLDNQLKPRDLSDHEIYQILIQKDLCARIACKCPQPGFLPLAGLDKVIGLIENQLQEIGGKYLFPLPGRGRATIEYKTLDLLFLLFGGEMQPETERLREEICNVALPLICRKQLEAEWRFMEVQLREHFSLYDLRYNLAAYVKRTISAVMQELEERDEAVRKTLDGVCHIKSASVKDIFESFSVYFEAWRSYVECSVQKSWLEEMENAVNNLSTQINETYSEWGNLRNMFRNSMLLGDVITPKCEKETYRPAKISDTHTIVRMLESQISYEYFDEKDIELIRKSLVAHYSNTEDYHVDVAKRPEIILFVHQDIGTIPECYEMFHWKMIPCGFIPRSEVYELKLYPCDL